MDHRQIMQILCMQNPYASLLIFMLGLTSHQLLTGALYEIIIKKSFKVIVYCDLSMLEFMINSHILDAGLYTRLGNPKGNRIWIW